jgi:hypothetical protein
MDCGDHEQRAFVRSVDYQVIARRDKSQRPGCDVEAPVALMGKWNQMDGVQDVFADTPGGE